MSLLGLTKDEISLFEEIKGVMDKYSHLPRKFGLVEVHQHFDMQKDEILHETHDKEQRVLTTQPMKKTDIPKNAKVSQWVFDEGQIKVAQYCCDPPE